MKSAIRGSGAASFWLTSAGLGEFTQRVADGNRESCSTRGREKGSRSCLFGEGEQAASAFAPTAYFFAVRWANLLRNFSTRPPSESTLFCVPV